MYELRHTFIAYELSFMVHLRFRVIPYCGIISRVISACALINGGFSFMCQRKIVAFSLTSMVTYHFFLLF